MGENTDWALMANCFDPTLLRNRITAWIGTQIRVPYTPQMIPVDFVMVGVQKDADGNMKERRPDRVMTDGHETHVVDFKFGSPKAEYHEQVREYMTLLSSMGMPNVKGWLWYVYNNKVEEVRGKM